MAYSGNQALPGLWPVHAGVAGTAPRLRSYVVDAAYATAIGEGNYLLKAADGLELAAATVAVDAAILVGVAAHNVTSTTGTQKEVLVYDDPYQEFTCIIDETLTATEAIEAIGQYVAVVSNTKSATLGQGLNKVDISTITSTRNTTDAFQITGWINNAGETLTGTNPSSQYAQVRVKFGVYNHIYSSHSLTGAT